MMRWPGSVAVSSCHPGPQRQGEIIHPTYAGSRAVFVLCGISVIERAYLNGELEKATASLRERYNLSCEHHTLII